MSRRGDLSMYDVDFYPDNDRALINRLVEQISESKDQRNYKEFRNLLSNLIEFGFEMKEEFKRDSLKKLEDDLFELRGTKIRIFITYIKGKFYVLNGFFKKSQKTPLSEIEIARRYIKEIKSRT